MSEQISALGVNDFVLMKHNKEGKIENKRKTLFIWIFLIFLISLIGFFLFIWFFN